MLFDDGGEGVCSVCYGEVTNSEGSNGMWDGIMLWDVNLIQAGMELLSLGLRSLESTVFIQVICQQLLPLPSCDL